MVILAPGKWNKSLKCDNEMKNAQCSPSSVDIEWTEPINIQDYIRGNATVRVREQPTTADRDRGSKTTN